MTSARLPFEEESDEDSVGIASTAESEPRSDYIVEDILAERIHPDNGLEYLIKWDGYLLSRATWEVAGNILGDGILPSWNRKQENIRQGRDVAFDVSSWTEAVEKEGEEREDRKRRRRAKRKRKGISVTPHSSDDDDDDEEQPPSRPARKRVQQPVVSRKGVAQKVGRKRPAERSLSPQAGPLFISDESSEEAEDEESEDEEMTDIDNVNEKPQHKTAVPQRVRSRPSSSNAQEVTNRPAPKRRRTEDNGPGEKRPSSNGGMSKTTDPIKASVAMKPKTSTPTRTVKSTKRPTSTSTKILAATKGPDVSKPGSVNSSSASTSRPSAPAVPIAARKSAPSTVASSVAKPSAPDVLGNWNAEKKRKERPRVSGETPKNSTDPKFKNLQQLQRHQLYSRNEPRPDISKLIPIDPKTGKEMSPKVPPQNTSSTTTTLPPQPLGTATIPGEYSRRTPPPILEQREKTPPSSPRPIQRPLAGTQAITASNSKPWEPTETCWFWANGVKCNFPEGECPRAHYQVEVFDPKKRTCYFWKRGFCKFEANECNYAHHDTGLDAEEPRDKINPVTQVPQGEGSGPKPNMTGRIPVGRPPKRAETTCHFWRTAKCNKSDSECAFAHFDTGIYAGPPGSYKKASWDAGGGPTATSANAIPVANNSHAPQNFGNGANESMQGLGDRNRTISVQTNGLEPHVPVQSPAYAQSPAEIRPSSRQVPSDWTILGAAERRQSNTSTTQMEATMQLSFPGQPNPAKFKTMLDVLNPTGFTDLAGTDPSLSIQGMIMAKDFENILWTQELWQKGSPSGGVLFQRGQDETVEQMQELCKSHAAGFIATISEQVGKMLIYPSNAEEWKFIDTDESRNATHALFRFRLFEDLVGAAGLIHTSQNAAISQDPRVDAVAVGEDLANLDTDRLNPTRSPDYPVFLMIPPTYSVELQVYLNYFQGLKCRVYTSEKEGAWSYFRKKFTGACLLVLHPDVQLWQIPGLYDFLNGGGKRLVFTIGINRTVAMLEEREPQFGCDRILAHGTVIFITDDVFAHHPQKAIDVIKSFLDANEIKHLGDRGDRIVTRPGLKDWVLRLVQQNTTSSDDRWLRLYRVITRLCPPDFEDAEDLGNPLPSSYLISMPLKSLPSFEGLWERNETAATDMMVEWFAGWSVLHANRFRRIMVCYESKNGNMRTSVDEHGRSSIKEEPDPRGWGKKYEHLGVQSADRVVAQLSKNRKK